MLFSFIATMALVLSEGVHHFVGGATDVDTAVAIDSPLYKPEDPSTMTLALIGAGTLAVYFASRRVDSNSADRDARRDWSPAF